MGSVPLQKTLRKLGKIEARARWLAAAKKALWPLIPSDLQPHCDLANYRDGVLVMTASSPVWATRLRQSSPAIIHRASGNIKRPVHRIEVRVVPPTAPKPSPQRRELSETAREHLRRCAALVGRDPKED